VPTEQRRVDVAGIKTAYLTVGNGEPLVLVHGAGYGAIQWFTVMGALSAHFQVVAPDVVGYGESDKPSASYDRPFFSAWLQGFVEALGLEKLSLVGTSQGGAIALQYTVDHPERVRRLVLVNSAGLGKVAQEVRWNVKLGMMWQNLFPSPRLSHWFLEHHSLFDPGRIDQAMIELEEYGREVLRMPGGRRAFWLGRGKAMEPIPVEWLQGILRPTLLIWGEQDQSFPVSSARAAIEIIPDAHLRVISGAGHTCFIEKPGEFNEVLLQFLKEGHSS
jgi:4,5:9,10-diseco-3-hydroxy-5,9,17-trioxoandrosta-1(10),2-diene-4-oate hydrolase